MSFLELSKNNSAISRHNIVNSDIIISQSSIMKQEICENDIEVPVNNYSNFIRQKLLSLFRGVSLCFPSTSSVMLQTNQSFSHCENKLNGTIDNQQLAHSSTNTNFVNSSRQVRRRSDFRRSKRLPNIDKIPYVSVPVSLPHVTVPVNNTTAILDGSIQNRLYCVINQRNGNQVGLKKYLDIVTLDELFLTEVTIPFAASKSTSGQKVVQQTERQLKRLGNTTRIEMCKNKKDEDVQEELEDLINQRNSTGRKNSVAMVTSTGELFLVDAPPAESSKTTDEEITEDVFQGLEIAADAATDMY